MCFVHWEKAFDRMDWNILMRIVRDIGSDWKDRRMISEIYSGQRVVVRIEADETEEMRIGIGLRQGCCKSPTLFNLYADLIMHEALEGLQRIKVG